MASNKQQQEELTMLFGAYNKRLGKLYAKFIKELSELGISVDEKLADNPLFMFDNFPELQYRLRDIFNQYVQDNLLLTKQGIASGVALAFGQDAKNLHGYTILNDSAIERVRRMAINAFTARRMNNPQGLNLSQNIWNYAQQTKSEFEIAMSNVIKDGLSKGTSAAELSLRVRDQLKEPDMMYRRYHHTVITTGGKKKDVAVWHKRVIDEDGNVRFVVAPLEEVGQGVYRSSYKNSFRLMRSEINMSYHYGNNARWRSEPFVLGIRIWGSPQHPKPDICDELWGVYPKDFDFAGFHPQCMCASAPVLCSKQERDEIIRRKQKGEDISNYVSPNAVTQVPDAFKEYVHRNRDKILAAGERGTLAYVFRDNPKYWRFEFNKDEQQKMGVYVQPKHVKTEAEKADIQRRWDERRRRMAIEARHAKRDDAAVQERWNRYQLERVQRAISNADIDAGTALTGRLNALYSAIKQGDIYAVQQAYAKAMRGVEIQKKWDELVWAGFSDELKRNLKQLAREIGIAKGRPMTHEQANTRHVNPQYREKYVRNAQGKLVLNPKWKKDYSINCQTTAPVYMLRRFGFNIEAKGNDGTIYKKILTKGYLDVWKKTDGTPLRMADIQKSTKVSVMYGWLQKQPDGVYQIGVTWKGAKSGHTFNYVKENGKGYFYDPQNNKRFDTLEAFKEYSSNVSPKYGYEFFRIDNLHVNVSTLSKIVKKSEFVDPIQLAREQRHAARDAKAIQNAWNERRKQNALKFNTAKNVIAAAQKHGYKELQPLISDLQDKLLTYRLNDAQQLAKQLAQQIACINKAVKSFKYVQDAKAHLKDVSLADLQAVEDAVDKKVQYVLSHTSDYAGQMKKYSFEAYDFLGANMNGIQQKFPNTWKISQEAYIKLYKEAKLNMDWQVVMQQYNQLKAFTTASPKYQQHIDNIEALLSLKDDLALAQQAIKDAEKYKKSLEASAKYRNKKKGGSSTTQATLGGSITDVQLLEMAERLADLRQTQAMVGKIKLTSAQQKAYDELRNAAQAGDVNKVNACLKKLKADLTDTYSAERKDLAMWAQDTKEADSKLRGTCGNVWQAASKAEKDAIHGYTQSYHNINEPLRGLTYVGSAAKTKEGLDRIPLVESIINKSGYDFDMWLQRGDGMIALKKFGLTNYNYASDADVYALVGREGTEGAYWSAGVAKGKGFTGEVIFNIYAPRGTHAMYCEPFSAFGHGAGRSWDGISPQSSFGYESEILIQRGTKFRITKVQKSGGQWYIDVEIIEQNPLPFPYVGGYPYPY